MQELERKDEGLPRRAARRYRRLGTEWPTAHLDLAVGAVVLLGYGVLQLWLLLGPHPYDPAYYFQLGGEFPMAVRDYWALRIGLVVPISLARHIFGASEAALYAVPLATGLLLAGAVYGTMVSLFRERLLGAAAALATVLCPVYLLNSSFTFPDNAATATFAAGFLCLVLGRRRPEQEDGGRAATLYALGAGLFFGWSYLIREFSPVLAPAVVAALVLLRYPLRRVALVVLAALATFSVELLYGAVGFHNPLARMHVLLERRTASITPARQELMERIHHQINDPLDSILVFPRLLLTWNTGWIFLLLLVIFVAGLVYFRDRRLVLLAVWCFGFWATMAAFGLWRLPTGELIVNVTNVRYWYPILPPLVMGGFGSLGLFVESFERKHAFGALSLVPVSALAALALVPGTLEFKDCAAKNVWRNEPAQRWGELRTWLATPEADRWNVLLSDKYSYRIVPIFAARTFGGRVWNGRFEELDVHPRLVLPKADLRRTLVLVHKRFLGAAAEPLRRNWSPVFESSDGALVLLAHGRASAGGGETALPWWRPPPPHRHAPGTCGVGL